MKKLGVGKKREKFKDGKRLKHKLKECKRNICDVRGQKNNGLCSSNVWNN